MLCHAVGGGREWRQYATDAKPSYGAFNTLQQTEARSCVQHILKETQWMCLHHMVHLVIVPREHPVVVLAPTHTYRPHAGNCRPQESQIAMCKASICAQLQAGMPCWSAAQHVRPGCLWAAPLELGLSAAAGHLAR